MEFRMRTLKLLREAAAVFLLAASLVSCTTRIEMTSALENIDSIPTMVMENMLALQSENGRLSGQLTAPVMERYTRGNRPYDIFPNTFKVIGYTPEGELETEITALKAIHRTGNPEQWEAYGNVVIINHIKQEKLETDTLYWDRLNKKIYTHCFVRLSSPDFFMQGYGMESDERASNAIILRPFDSYGNFKKEDLAPKDSVAVADIEQVEDTAETSLSVDKK